MTYRPEERYLGGILAGEVVELNAAYERSLVASPEEFPEAYGSMVRAMVSMFGALPDWVREALQEQSSRYGAETRWRTLSSGEESPENALFDIYGALGEFRQYVNSPFYGGSQKPAGEWQQLMNNIFSGPLKELLSWCPVSDEVRAQNLQGDAGLVRVYHDGDIICSGGKRCYCEGDRDGACNGL